MKRRSHVDRIFTRNNLVFEMGFRDGEARGEARALLTVLTGRGLRVTEAQRKRILETTDRAQLEAWLTVAATAPTTGAVLRVTHACAGE